MCQGATRSGGVVLPERGDRAADGVVGSRRSARWCVALRNPRGKAALLTFLLLAPLLASAQDFALADLMALMAEVPSTTSRFTEKKHLAILKEPLMLTGTLTYKRPDFVEKHVTSPYQERFTVSGDSVSFENKTKNQKRNFSLASNPVIRAFVDSIRATLAGDGKALQRFYRADLKGTPKAWVLNLEPLDAQMAEQVSTIRLSGASNAVTEVTVFEPGGDKSVMSIAPQ